MAATTFRLGDITIHRVVEQEGPFFNPLECFPSLTPEVLEENRGWMTEGGYLDRQSGNSCSASRPTWCKRRTTTF